MKLYKNLLAVMALSFSVSALSTTAMAEEQTPNTDEDVVRYLDNSVDEIQADDFTTEATMDPMRIIRPPHRGRGYVCYARNARGQWFEGRAMDRVTARKRALESCARRSARCYADRCSY